MVSLYLFLFRLFGDRVTMGGLSFLKVFVFSGMVFIMVMVMGCVKGFWVGLLYPILLLVMVMVVVLG